MSQPATQGRVLADPNLKKNADSADTLRNWFTSINGDVAPLDEVGTFWRVEFSPRGALDPRLYTLPSGRTSSQVTRHCSRMSARNAETKSLQRSYRADARHCDMSESILSI